MLLLRIVVRILATLHRYAERWLPWNRLIVFCQTRQGLKWGPVASLLAVPCFLASATCTTLIRAGGPGWLNLIGLWGVWTGFRLLWLGPVSLARLVKARLAGAR